MKKAMLLLAALSILWVYQSNENVASAHGGSYRGPAGEVPPGQRDPKDPQPPPDNPGSPTPNPGGPPTPDPGTGGSDGGNGGGEAPPPTPGPAAPQPPGPVGPSLPGGAVTGGGRRAGGGNAMSFDNWLFWWAYNKDEILNIKAALKKMANKADSKSSPFFFGGGESTGAGAQAPTERMVNEEIVPVLEKIVATKDIHPDIRGGALIALSRCRGSKHVELFFQSAARDSGDDRVVQESAILALGIGQYKDPEVRDTLIKIVDDTEYPFRGRCFAMMSLGLLQDNSDEVMNCLKRRLDGSESHQDISVCALLSIGLIGDNKVVPELVEWLDAGRIGRMKVSDLEKAWILSALGKIGDPQALKAVLDTLKKKGLYPVRSAMIAVGQLLPQADEKTQIETLRTFARAVDSEGDATAKNFGYISLGRIGGAPDASEEVRTTCRKLLEKYYRDGNKVTERPYAALAIGLLGFEAEGQTKGQEFRYELADIVKKEFQELKGEKTALGASAITLGMLGDRRKETTDLLISVLQDRGQDKKLRGSAAMALGLIGAPAAKEAVMKALEEREDRDLRVDTAVAAGLLGDSDAVQKLVDVLNDPKASQFVLGSVALALGQIGDKRAIGPLTSILEPEKVNGTYPDLTRALVAVALGQIADQSDIRVLYRISKDVNYRATVGALDEILTVL